MRSRRQSVIRLLDAPHLHSPPATDVVNQSSTAKLKIQKDNHRTLDTPILSPSRKRKFNRISSPQEDKSEGCGYIHYPHILAPTKAWEDSIRRQARFFNPGAGMESTEPWGGSGACRSPERKTCMVKMFCDNLPKKKNLQIGYM